MDYEDGHNGGLYSGGGTSIIGAEDEYFENDIEPNVDNQSSNFQTIEFVKEHPAYIMVFLHHVVLQFDPSPLLCFLHAEILRHLSPKEGKKAIVDFFNTFLMKGAVLRVIIPPNISFELDRTRIDLIPDDTLRKYLQEIQSQQFPEITRQLEDFRAKRVLGMTPGESELKELESYRTNDKDILRSKEKQVAERLLSKLDDMHPSISSDEEKSSAIVHAIATYMKHIGVKTKAADSKKPKSGFFRKMVSAKKPDEPPKTKKPFSIWNRNETTHNVEPRPKVEPEVDKPVVQERRISYGHKTCDRSDSTVAKSKASIDIPEPGVSVNIHPPPSEPSDSDTVSDGTSSMDVADATKGSPIPELCTADQQEESAENDRSSSKVGRSESLRVYERKRSQRGSAKGKQTRSRSDVDLEAAARANDMQLSSSKTGNKSATMTPEPGGSGEGPPSFLLPQSEENEPRVLESENDPPNWRELVPPETLLRLKKSEIKRQEVINELLFTEHAHVRMLRVLHDIFYFPMQKSWIQNMELETIFPSLDELIEAHALFLDNLKKLRLENNSIVQEIGNTLLQRFDGTEGLWFQKISSRFCSRQPFALEQLKQKQKKDPRFTQFIQEAESKPQCRRLQLKDIIPIEMQRLTKYPLLLQNVANLTDEEEEKQRVQKAAECCRQILNHVNTEVREMENKMKLSDYQRRLDMSNLKQSNDPLFNEFKNIDISKRNLIYEGALTWRVSKDKSVDVHVLLLDEIMMLLQKQDERLVLKCQSRALTPTPDGKLMLSPIIKLNTAMAREVATDNKAFFVIFKWEERPQIYELVAPTTSEKNIWYSLVKQSTGHLESAPSKPRTSYRAAGMIPQSPSDFNENGGSLKESAAKDDKEESLEDAVLEPEESLGDSSTISEHLLTHNFQTYKRNQDTTGGNVASGALEEVAVLKRLLVRNIRLSLDADSLSNMDSWSDFSREESGGSQNTPDDKAPNGDQEGNEPVVEPEREGQDLGENGQDLVSRDVGESLCAPIVLSQEQSEKVRRHILLLEQSVQQLKLIEEDYHHLQRTVAKFTQSSFT